MQYCYVAAEEKEMSSENLSCTLPLPSQPPSKPQSHFQLHHPPLLHDSLNFVKAVFASEVLIVVCGVKSDNNLDS